MIGDAACYNLPGQIMGGCAMASARRWCKVATLAVYSESYLENARLTQPRVTGSEMHVGILRGDLRDKESSITAFKA